MNNSRSYVTESLSKTYIIYFILNNISLAKCVNSHSPLSEQEENDPISREKNRETHSMKVQK